MTTWSTEVAVEGDEVVVKLMLSMDPGPMREFRPFLDVPLDEANATELLCKLSTALAKLRETRR
jgi:hypothetical protein